MIEVKQLVNKEKENAFEFVKKVYLESEDDSYTEKGIKTFCEFVDNIEVTRSFKTYGAFENDTLLGVIALDKRKRHINFFFVDKSAQGKGVGKILMEHILKENKNSHISVNSSRYAVPIYSKFGFEKMEEEKEVDGLVFTSMRKILMNDR